MVLLHYAKRHPDHLFDCTGAFLGFIGYGIVAGVIFAVMIWAVVNINTHPPWQGPHQ